MARFELKLPKMGESVAEATITNWLKKVGDFIEIDEAVLEIATDKVDSEVPSEVEGVLIEQLFQKDDLVQVGQVIAIIETEVNAIKESIETPVVADIQTIESVSEVSTTLPEIEAVLTQPLTQSNEFSKLTDRFLSPLVKNIALEEGITSEELNSIKGTGLENRITKNDILEFVKNKSIGHSNSSSLLHFEPEISQIEPKEIKSELEKSVESIQPEIAIENTAISEPKQAEVQKNVVFTPRIAETQSNKPKPIAVDSNISKVAPSVNGGDEIIEMDRMRKLISGYMVASVQTSAHVQSFIEVDVTNIVKWRDKNKANFEKRENEKLTFTPIFMEAVAKALKDFPNMNISVEGDYIIKKKNINLGMAAALPNGNLIVPVIKNADQLNLVGMAKAVNDLGNRAKQGKLKPDDTHGGTYTVTNVGTFGSVFGTPIINQPQVGILALGAIRKVPAVIETPEGDFIGIRQKMFLSHSYDHRVVDGALGGSFVKRVAEYLEAWDINREI